MSELVHRVGVHDVSLAPGNLLKGADYSARVSRLSNADFWAHLPTWGDLLASNPTVLDAPPDYVDSSWWVDRAVERNTPPGHPKSRIDTLKVTALTMAYPVPPLGRELTQRWLDAHPDSGLLIRWPVYESDKISENLNLRNEILREMSPKVDSRREVLDVHSTNIGLTPDQIEDWQDQVPGRRLMVSAQAIDERLEQHRLDVRGQQALVEPLLQRVSVVTLKLGDLKAPDGEVKMTREEIVEGVVRADYNNPYSVMVREFRDRVGADSNKSTVDWMIKLKGGLPRDFLPRFVDYAKEVLIR